jgi:hypothetical protein
LRGSLSKISYFEYVVYSWTVGVLREESGEEAMEAQRKEHKEDTIEVTFVRYVMLLVAKDHQGYLCLSP